MSLARASHGPILAEGVGCPVSVAARGGWSFERPVFAADTTTFGGHRPSGQGTGRGELEVEGACALDGEHVGGMLLVAWLRSAYVALVGAVRVEGRVGHSLSFTFTEEVSHEPA